MQLLCMEILYSAPLDDRIKANNSTGCIYGGIRLIVYSIIMFAGAVAFAVFAILISKGNTNLINCYHEDRVVDKIAYCERFSRSLWVLAAVLTASGLVGLLGETDTVALCAVGVLFVGMIGGISWLVYVQKKYGGGIF